MRLLSLAAAATVLALPAHAQRADDNAVKAAEDAFGTSVGNEQVGLYNSGDVRGFSPEDAGNIRLEGLYFDRATGFTSRLIEGSTVRVGLTAQGYAFPAPTGIVDYSVRHARGDRARISPVVQIGEFDAWAVEADAELPLDGERLGVAFGAGLYRDDYPTDTGARFFSTAIIPTWRPRKGVELTAFWSRVEGRDEEPSPLIFVDGPYLPPKIERRHFFGQRWQKSGGEFVNFGLIGTADVGAWDLKLGVFRSVGNSDRDFSSLFVGTTEDGATERLVVAYPASRSASTSGEARITRRFAEGPRQHSFLVSLRGRARDEVYGGSDLVSIGPGTIGVRDDVPEPVFRFGPRTRSRVEQMNIGLGYEARWRDVGELTLGLQQIDYRKSIDIPGEDRPDSKASPLLPNVALALRPWRQVALFGSYARGLEESPSAPSVAINRSEAPPALETEQVDAGVRIILPRQMRLLAGVFRVEKPYFGLDEGKRFRELGRVTNEGVELSLSGEPLKGLTIVAGTVFLDARISGDEVDAGIVGETPVGAIERTSQLNVEYALPFAPGLSLDLSVTSYGEWNASRLGDLKIPARTVPDVGARYRFKLGRSPAQLRARVGNVLDIYGWRVGSGENFSYNAPRRFSLNLAVDL